LAAAGFTAAFLAAGFADFLPAFFAAGFAAFLPAVFLTVLAVFFTAEVAETATGFVVGCAVASAANAEVANIARTADARISFFMDIFELSFDLDV
jgi:hypothetical protein